MREILRVNVSLEDVMEVKGARRSASMVLFSGTAEGPYFHGKVLPHGIDTQMRTESGPMTLSARYILEGTDDLGKSCRIFIENNGTESPGRAVCTRPVIVTDSPSLAWMEHAALRGTVEGTAGGVVIHILADKD